MGAQRWHPQSTSSSHLFRLAFLSSTHNHSDRFHYYQITLIFCFKQDHNRSLIICNYKATSLYVAYKRSDVNSNEWSMDLDKVAKNDTL